MGITYRLIKLFGARSTCVFNGFLTVLDNGPLGRPRSKWLDQIFAVTTTSPRLLIRGDVLSVWVKLEFYPREDPRKDVGVSCESARMSVSMSASWNASFIAR